MIELKKLRWGNLFSYGDNNELDLTKSQLTQIVGYNGHGKSSIALILEEVLYNKNSKGIKKADILNRNGNSKTYWIELDFRKDQDEYLIKTSRSSTQTVKLFKNGEDISGHTATTTYATIADLIGYDHKTFTQIVYQSSSASLEFLTATDSNRKKFLIDLLNLTKYVEAGEVFKQASKDLGEKITSITAKIESANSILAKYAKFDLTEKAEVKVPESPRELIEQVQVLQEKIKSIDTINKSILQNNKYKELRDSITLNTAIQKPSLDISDFTSKKAILTKTIEDESKFVLKMQKLGAQCPTCLQAIDKQQLDELVGEHQQQCTLAEGELRVIKQIIADYNSELELWNAEQKRVEEYEKYHNLYDETLQTVPLTKQDLEAQITELESSIQEINQRIKKATEHNTQAIAHNAKISVVKTQLEDSNNELSDLKLELEAHNKRLGVLQVLVKTFSSTGLVAYKIECLIKDLEETTNSYLTELSGGRFQLTFKVASDKLNVVITDNGKDVDITALSSGEKARVNAAALLGIRRLMQGLSNNRINLLVLDETIENLDLEGKEKLVEVLLAEDFLNTFIISHSFSHPLLERVYVTKENNISRIDHG